VCSIRSISPLHGRTHESNFGEVHGLPEETLSISHTVVMLSAINIYIHRQMEFNMSDVK